MLAKHSMERGKRWGKNCGNVGFAGRLAALIHYSPKTVLKTILFSTLASMMFIPLSAGAAFSRQCSEASFYGYQDGFAWQTMANGQPMNPNALTTAHRSLPFGTRLRVVNQDNGRSVVVTVTDDGPYVGGRALDLSYGAFRRIASASQGVARVCFAKV